MDLIRLEFWNGHNNTSKKNLKYHGHMKTSPNPCLWSNIGIETHPWREVYQDALKALDRWYKKELTDTEFLHHLRYVAYGLGKRHFDDREVVWPSNLTIRHEPKLVVSIVYYFI